MDINKLTDEEIDFILDNLDDLRELQLTRKIENLNIKPGQCFVSTDREDCYLQLITKVIDNTVYYTCITDQNIPEVEEWDEECESIEYFIERNIVSVDPQEYYDLKELLSERNDRTSEIISKLKFLRQCTE